MSEDPTPPVNPNNVPLNAVAEESLAALQYVQAELRRARKSFAVTRVVSVAFVIIALIETIYVCGNMQRNLQPRSAAYIADGVIAARVDDHSDDMKAAIEQKLPTFVAQIPDLAIAQAPILRQSLETRFTSDLTNYSKATSDQLGKQLDAYISDHSDEVKAAMAGGQDTAAIHELGSGLTQTFIESLKTSSDNGESAQQQIDTSLAQLKDVRQKMDRLASDKNLTPDEKRTRHLIALMGRTVQHNVPAVSVAQAGVGT